MTNSEQIVRDNPEIAAELLGCDEISIHCDHIQLHHLIEIYDEGPLHRSVRLTLEHVNAAVARECEDSPFRRTAYLMQLSPRWKYACGGELSDVVWLVDQATALDKLAALIKMRLEK